MDVGWENPPIFSMVSQDLESTPTETIILKWMFQVPGAYVFLFLCLAMTTENCCLFFQLEFLCLLEEFLPPLYKINENHVESPQLWWKIYHNFQRVFPNINYYMFIAYLLWAFSRISITLLVLSENNFRFQAPKNNSRSKSTFACRAQKKGTFWRKTDAFLNSPKNLPNGGAKPRRFQSSDPVKKRVCGWRCAIRKMPVFLLLLLLLLLLLGFSGGLDFGFCWLELAFSQDKKKSGRLFCVIGEMCFTNPEESTVQQKAIKTGNGKTSKLRQIHLEVVDCYILQGKILLFN